MPANYPSQWMAGGSFGQGPMTSYKAGGEETTFSPGPQLQGQVKAPENLWQQIGTQGFGIMPQSASPYSQALQGAASNIRARGMALAGGGRDPQADYLERMSSSANIGFQERQQEFQRQMQDQQLQSAMLKNQAFSKLLGLFGGGGGPENPAQAFLASVYGGGVQGLADSPLMQKMLQGVNAQTTMAFEPAQRQLQTQRAAQGRYALDSGASADMANRLAQRESLARQAGYGQAWAGTLAGMQPMLQAAQTTSQFASSQQNQLPQMLSLMMRG